MKKKITIKQKKEKLLLFAPQLEIIINEMIDFNDTNETSFSLFKNGYYWHFIKNVFESHLIEIRARKTNYKEINELSKGERVNESCWVYLNEQNNAPGIKIGRLLINDYNCLIF